MLTIVLTWRIQQFAKTNCQIKPIVNIYRLQTIIHLVECSQLWGYTVVLHTFTIQRSTFTRKLITRHNEHLKLLNSDTCIDFFNCFMHDL